MKGKTPLLPGPGHLGSTRCRMDVGQLINQWVPTSPHLQRHPIWLEVGVGMQWSGLSSFFQRLSEVNFSKGNTLKWTWLENFFEQQFSVFFEIMEALPFPKVSHVAETNRKMIWGIEDLPILTPLMSGSLGQTSWILEAEGMFALIRALPWSLMKQSIFMKGELDTRPTTFQERLCQARNGLKLSCIWFSEKWKRTKSRQDAFPVVRLLLHRKWLLIWEIVSFFGWFSERDPSSLLGLGKFVMFFSKERRGAVVSTTATAFITVDLLPWGHKPRFGANQ